MLECPLFWWCLGVRKMGYLDWTLQRVLVFCSNSVDYKYAGLSDLTDLGFWCLIGRNRVLRISIEGFKAVWHSISIPLTLNLLDYQTL